MYLYIFYKILFSCAFYCCGNIQSESLKLFPVGKKKIISWTVCKTNIFAGVRCVCMRQQPWGSMVERNVARPSERSWRAGRWNLRGHHPHPLTARTNLGIELWTWGQELSTLERNDGKPACLPWTHRQRRGRATVGPGRQGRMLPGPQQWLGAGRLLSVCAVSLNPKWHFSS